MATATKKPRRKAKQETVHVSIVIDESGSMMGLEESVVTGFNEFVHGLRGDGDHEGKSVLVTLHQFDTRWDGNVRTKFKGIPLAEVRDMYRDDYRPMGATPLFDAVHKAVSDLSAEAKEGDRPMVVILTDGEENSSEVTRETISELVAAKEAEGWVFLYLGANHDACWGAQNLGINTDRPGSHYGWASTRTGTASSLSTSGTLASTHVAGGQSYAAANTAYASMSGGSIPEDITKAREIAAKAAQAAKAQAKEGEE